MGAYYCAINRTKKEWLDPGQVGGGNIKWAGVHYGDFPRLLGYAMAGTWKGDDVAVVCDSDERDGDQWHNRGDFRDVTREMVADFNEGADGPMVWRAPE